MGQDRNYIKKFGTRWDMTRLYSHLPEDASLMTGESGLQNNVRELQGANMDIDLTSENVGWNQVCCPWNEAENSKVHKCAVNI